MATITTRSGKGSPLTNTEVDSNFTNLNTAKVEKSGDSMTGNLSFGDNVKAIFGAGSDLQIYHDGDDSFISDQGASNLKILAENFIVKNAADTENMLNATPDGAVNLYYDNALKLATTSTGIDVTGTVTADGLTVAYAEGTDGIKIQDSTNVDRWSIRHFKTGLDKLFIRCLTTGNDALQITAGNDISFYEDTGTTAKFFWDASAESLGIGTSSPTTGATGTFSGLNIQGTATNGELTALLVRNPDSTADTSGKVSIEMKASNSNRRGPKITAFKEGTYADAATADAGISFHTVVNDAYVDALTIKQSGNVGIGTSSPSNYSGYTAVTINNATNGGLLEVQNNGTTYGQVFTDGSTFNIRSSASSSALVFDTNGGNERMRIDSSGNVGIGTSSFDNPQSWGRILQVTNTGANGSGISVKDSSNEYNIATYNGYLLISDGLDERITIDSSGNVGIGTTSQNERLRVNSSTSAQARVTVAYADTPISYYGSYLGIVGSGNATDVTLTSANALAFGTGGTTERMRIDSSGNVGIGTSSPTVGFEYANTSPILKIKDSNSTGNAANPYVSMVDSTGSLMGAMGFASAADGNLYVWNQSANPISFVTNATEHMRIDSSGNVGIGTASPVASSLLTLKETNAGGDGAELRLINSSTTTESATQIVFTNTTTDSANSAVIKAVRTASGQDFRFSSDGSERMRIDSSGNLLVGTTDTTIYSNSGAGTGGAVIANTGDGFRIDAARAGTCFSANRLVSDGSIFDLRKDGSTVGSIGVGEVPSTDRCLTIGKSDSGILFDNVSNRITPWDMNSNAVLDNSIDLGYSGGRFKNLYLSGGVYLGGTGSANYLDDYESGSWTPAITNGTANYAYGYYVKVGDSVTVWGFLSLSSRVSNSTAQKISGLPFSIRDTVAGTSWSSTGVVEYDALGTNIVRMPTWFADGTTNFNMYKVTAASSSSFSSLLGSDLNNTSSFRFTATYSTT